MAISQVVTNSIASGQTITSPTLVNPTISGTVTNAAGTAPLFRVYPSASQAINNGATVLIQNNTEVYDVGGCFNNTGSTVTLNGISAPAYSFTPNVAGYYWISGIVFLGASSGSVQTNIYVNGGTVICASSTTNANGVGPQVGLITYLNGTGDYVQLAGYNATGSNLNTLANRSDLNIFEGFFIRSA